MTAVTEVAERISIGQWDAQPEPTIGPLISAAAAERAQHAYDTLVALGVKIIKPLGRPLGRSDAFVTPAILDVTDIDVPDEEIFAPLIQIIRVPDFDAAVRAANATAYGLAAGLISRSADRWEHYASRARAGVVNWNRPTTGASAGLPFGGLGESGNHRPSAYYAADYCAYPVASFEADEVSDLSGDWRGLATPQPLPVKR